LCDVEKRAAHDIAAELVELRQQVTELRGAVRARDDFIAIAAHELRNTITPIVAAAELALKAARTSRPICPPRVTALLERIAIFTQSFVQRSTRLLDVGRIEAGNLRLDPSATNLSALVLSITQSYQDTAARARCEIELDLPVEIIGIVDRLALEQVIENLLSNALKFGIGQPVTLRLRLDDCWARLDVQDRGIGMSPEQQTGIFGRFEQVMAQHRGSGFGVGLWIANRLVAAMGGRITVASRLGEGSTFTVALPFVSPERIG
jgi:two-component system OmpR family sensor kinase